MSRSLPFAFLFFRARGKNKDIMLFIRRLNELLNRQGNMFLLSRARFIKNPYSEGFFLIVPCNFSFPFVIWPLYWLPRIIYTIAIIMRGRGLSVRLRPCPARDVAGALYEATR